MEETAELLDLHKNTIRRWIKQGLPTIDDQRPTLILGPDLINFLRNKRKASKQPCPPGHLYCVKCRVPRRPDLNMADYMPLNDLNGNLRGICPQCETLMHRRVSLKKLKEVYDGLEIQFCKPRNT